MAYITSFEILDKEIIKNWRAAQLIFKSTGATERSLPTAYIAYC